MVRREAVETAVSRFAELPTMQRSVLILKDVLDQSEAMKLMNEIESDAAGEIVKCLVSNGQPIEFGQPLFTIRPA